MESKPSANLNDEGTEPITKSLTQSYLRFY